MFWLSIPFLRNPKLWLGRVEIFSHVSFISLISKEGLLMLTFVRPINNQGVSFFVVGTHATTIEIVIVVNLDHIPNVKPPSFPRW